MAETQKGCPDNLALEMAAKYICTIKCGQCPLVVEKFPCPQKCTLDVLPWQCWLAYFAKVKGQPAD
ncbi:MAG: hypothetical protein OEY01_13170 [Desulfobulbaceae bacterium]|nr:hypothetical protein [Desulfobulbaceae bacterium]HIJ79680.1 hypothetical protein [Deltaproteobacteria bacterium]